MQNLGSMSLLSILVSIFEDKYIMIVEWLSIENIINFIITYL